jgi:SAM-dependent methyltransferase
MSALARLGVRPSPRPAAYSESQDQTRQAFGFKWSLRGTYESPAVKETSRQWLIERYCSGDPSVIDEWFSGERKILLDAGCGSGFSALLLFGDRLRHVDYLGVDISDAVDVARARFEEAGIPGDFLQADLMHVPVPQESVDIIFSEGVLHHTDSTERAIRALTPKLKRGGRFMFYVYAKKAVIREFTDDYVRAQLQPMTDEDAWKALEPLTKLGIALGQLGLEIVVPEDIPLLGIRKGRLDIQRFFYWHVCKAYYRPDYSLDEMNHINFDWYRPLNCHRHTPDELVRWCKEVGLRVDSMNVQEAGVTIVAKKVAGAAPA